MKKLLLTLTALLVMAFGGDFEDAKKAEMAGDYKTAIELYEKEANKGNVYAQIHLAHRCREGYAIERDDNKINDLYQKAFKKLTKLAEQGDINAQYHLGILYKYGRGVDKDLNKSNQILQNVAIYYEKEAKKGNAEAQYRLGEMYKYKYGVELNIEKAIKYFRMAAEKGDANAQFEVGFYSKGNKQKEWYKKAAEQKHADAQVMLAGLFIFSKDYKKAAEYYKMASDQGGPEGQYSLALAYYLGSGVEQDKIKAYKLWTKSAHQGFRDAQHYLERLCKESPWACKQ